MVESMVWVQKLGEKIRKGNLVTRSYRNLETVNDPPRRMLFMKESEWRDYIKRKFLSKFGGGKYRVTLVLLRIHKYVYLYDWKKDGEISAQGD